MEGGDSPPSFFTYREVDMKEGDKVKSNGKYADIQRKFGDTVQTVKYVGKIPSCKQDMVWLKGGGGCFMADGFTVVEG
jgi:hypothetical protein